MSTTLMPYLEHWRKFDCARKPYVHEEDDTYMKLYDKQFAKLRDGRYDTGVEGGIGSKKLHLGLLPAPHTGDIANDKYHFLPLDPSLSDNGGYEYWNRGGKLGGLVRQLANNKFAQSSDAKTQAQQFLSQHIATIEVMPYKSHTYSSECDKLPSFQLAKALVNEHLRARAKKDEVLVIVTRKLRDLGFASTDASKNFILYDPKKEARSASTGPNSRGGKAILEWLGMS